LKIYHKIVIKKASHIAAIIRVSSKPKYSLTFQLKPRKGLVFFAKFPSTFWILELRPSQTIGKRDKSFIGPLNTVLVPTLMIMMVYHSELDEKKFK
jgi:hypothetical protein